MNPEVFRALDRLSDQSHRMTEVGCMEVYKNPFDRLLFTLTSTNVLLYVAIKYKKIIKKLISHISSGLGSLCYLTAENKVVLYLPHH